MSTKFYHLFLLVFVSGFFYTNHAVCQKNFLPGMIITLKSDTIKGFIDYQNWAKNPKSILFKLTENEATVEYNPITIKGFYVHGEVYIGAVVQAEASHQMEYGPGQIKEADYKPEIITRTDTIFLQALFQGSKNLYYSYDKKGKSQFYIKQWPDFELLQYKKYLRYNEERSSYGSTEALNTLKENKKFIGQLTLYFQDCPSLQQNTNSTVYEQKSMDNLFDNYYKCAKTKPDYRYKKEKTKLEFGVVAGLSSTKLLFSSSDEYRYRYIVTVDYPVSNKFTGGLLFDIVMARNQRRWSIYNELIYTSYSASQHFEEITNQDIYSFIDTKIDYSYLKWNSLLRYKYLVKNDWFLYTNIGISFGQTIAGSNSIITDKTIPGNNTITEKELFTSSKSETGLVAGLGGGFKKYSFEARYERGDGISGMNSLRSRTNRIYFMLGYRF